MRPVLYASHKRMRVVSEEPAIDDLATVVDDDCMRCLLVHAYDQYMTVNELAEHCDVSASTVYRRLELLQDLDLVQEQTQPDQDGHHSTAYQTTLDTLTITVTDDGFEAQVQRENTMAKRLTDIVEDL